MNSISATIRELIRAIRYQFGAFIGSVLTVFLAMLIAGSFAIVAKNISNTLDRFRTEASLEIYLETDIDSTMRDAIQDSLVADKYIIKSKLIDKQTALYRLRQTFGQEIVAGLKTNPLPESFELTLEPEVYDGDNFEKMVERLKSLDGVEEVGYLPQAVSKLRAIFKLITILGITLGLLVVLATGFIVGNTIHVKIAERRHTFYIMRLVGAGRGFIYTPYLLLGSLIGCLGSAGSIIALRFATVYFNAQVIGIDFLNNTEFVSFILAGTIVGLAGSHLALKRYLDI